MRTAVFASGGGFNGAYQAGAIERLSREGIQPSFGYGISVGSLNVAKWMMGDVMSLSTIWHGIEFGDIFSGPRWWHLATDDGMYSNEPLRELIEREIDPDQIQGEFFCGAVNLSRRRYEVFGNGLPGGDVRRGILASTAMPFYHTSVSIDGEKYVDGGVWNITPIGDLLRLSGREIDHIYVINCQMGVETDREPTEVRGVASVATESISMMMRRNVEADVRFFRTVNKIVEAAGGGPIGKYRYIPATVIEPRERLGSSMDADRTRLRALYYQGFDDACRALRNPA